VSGWSFNRKDRNSLDLLAELCIQVRTAHQRMGGRRRSDASSPAQRYPPSCDLRHLRRGPPGRGGDHDRKCYRDAGPEPPAARDLAGYLRGDRELSDRDELSGGECPIDEDTRTHFYS